MILYKGKIYDSSCQQQLMQQLPEDLLSARGRKIDTDRLISVLDQLSLRIQQGEYDGIIRSLDLQGIELMVSDAVRMLKSETLKKRLAEELTPLPESEQLIRRRVPLGVLLHIAAGNMEVLPAYTVIEGLMAGNINILKLPQSDNGLTVRILEELISLDGELAEFVYVFDTPSEDVEALKLMASNANGIVIWGSDEAVKAVRSLADPATALIEWGHKLSFVYVNGRPDDSELADLADHLNSTRGRLCSSAQVIYLNTDERSVAEEFCERLRKVMDSRFVPGDLVSAGKLAINEWTGRLEQAIGKSTGRMSHGISSLIMLADDEKLEAGEAEGQISVKMLKKERLIEVLPGHRGHLQTAGVIRPDEQLREILMAAGVTRITSPANMSRYLSGESHDGRQALACYTRIVDIER